VKITLDADGPYSVDNIAAGSGTPIEDGHALGRLNDRITKGTVVAGRITYPAAAGLDNREGVLIFAKAVLWESCPHWLLTYAARKVTKTSRTTRPPTNGSTKDSSRPTPRLAGSSASTWCSAPTI
jgi:hypothetical protein